MSATLWLALTYINIHTWLMHTKLITNLCYSYYYKSLFINLNSGLVSIDQHFICNTRNVIHTHFACSIQKLASDTVGIVFPLSCTLCMLGVINHIATRQHVGAFPTT